MKRLSYISALLLLGFVSCRDFHVTLMGDAVLAEVGSKSLMQSDIAKVLPKEYRGEDSVVFVEVFIDKWIHKQVKMRQAETVFSTSQTDIDAMVEEYRQLLLIRRLDELCVSSSVDTTYTDDQIAEYYNRNASSFRLNSPIVKGEVVRLPLDNEQSKKLRELMSSTTPTSRNDFEAICEKNGFDLIDLSSSWVDAAQMLDLLPLTRGAQTDKLLSVKGVNQMNDGSHDYFYQIFDHKEAGDIAPLEWVRSTIRTILITERQQELIKAYEEVLYKSALEEGVVKRQYQDTEIK